MFIYINKIYFDEIRIENNRIVNISLRINIFYKIWSDDWNKVFKILFHICIESRKYTWLEYLFLLVYFTWWEKFWVPFIFVRVRKRKKQNCVICYKTESPFFPSSAFHGLPLLWIPGRCSFFIMYHCSKIICVTNY